MTTETKEKIIFNKKMLSNTKYPELRFAINNGTTLCLGCHKKTDSFGVRFDLK